MPSTIPKGNWCFYFREKLIKLTEFQQFQFKYFLAACFGALFGEYLFHFLFEICFKPSLFQFYHIYIVH